MKKMHPADIRYIDMGMHRSQQRIFDSRDPEYDGPDDDEETLGDVEDDFCEPEDHLDEDDPRLDGPRHYCPPGEY